MSRDDGDVTISVPACVASLAGFSGDKLAEYKTSEWCGIIAFNTACCRKKRVHLTRYQGSAVLVSYRRNLDIYNFKERDLALKERRMEYMALAPAFS